MPPHTIAPAMTARMRLSSGRRARPRLELGGGGLGSIPQFYSRGKSRGNGKSDLENWIKSPAMPLLTPAKLGLFHRVAKEKLSEWLAGLARHDQEVGEAPKGVD